MVVCCFEYVNSYSTLLLLLLLMTFRPGQGYLSKQHSWSAWEL